MQDPGRVKPFSFLFWILADWRPAYSQKIIIFLGCQEGGVLGVLPKL